MYTNHSSINILYTHNSHSHMTRRLCSSTKVIALTDWKVFTWTHKVNSLKKEWQQWVAWIRTIGKIACNLRFAGHKNLLTTSSYAGKSHMYVLNVPGLVREMGGIGSTVATISQGEISALLSFTITIFLWIIRFIWGGRESRRKGVNGMNASMYPRQSPQSSFFKKK